MPIRMSRGMRGARLGCLTVALCVAGAAQSSSKDEYKPSPASSAGQKEAPLTAHASGTFEVKMEPQAEDKAAGASLGRMSLNKQFHGGLEGVSKGEMLTAMSGVEGSAGYVAIERFSGLLDGRSGTFALQHSGTMRRGTPQQSVAVVPDSGSGELTGLAGTMTITITDGKHSYEFEYTIGATK